VIPEGSRSTIVRLQTSLHEGSPMSRVDTVESEWLAATGEFDEFYVR